MHWLKCYVGTPISAHRALLAARSEAFKAMLLNDMSEASMKTITLKEIKFDILTLVCKYLPHHLSATISPPPTSIIKNIYLQLLIQLVQYFYTDCVTITETNVVDLLMASDRFQVYSPIHSY